MPDVIEVQAHARTDCTAWPDEGAHRGPQAASAAFVDRREAQARRTCCPIAASHRPATSSIRLAVIAAAARRGRNLLTWSLGPYPAQANAIGGPDVREGQ